MLKMATNGCCWNDVDRLQQSEKRVRPAPPSLEPDRKQTGKGEREVTEEESIWS